MANSKVPTIASLIEIMQDIPDEAIEVICFRVATTDHRVYHWHYTDTGEWSSVSR